MDGELSSGVRGLRSKESFAGDSHADETLNPLIGSLNRLQTACDEALAALLPSSDSGLGDVDSDWDRLQCLKAEYAARLLAEEAFVASGAERKFVERDQRLFERLDRYAGALRELEIAQEKLRMKNAEVPYVSIDKIRELERAITKFQGELENLGRDAARWQRLSCRIAPSGADMKQWTIERLRSYAEALEQHKSEIDGVRLWIAQARQTAEEQKKWCVRQFARWDEVFRQKRSLEINIRSCKAVGKDAMGNEMSLPMARFLSCADSAEVDEVLAIDVVALQDEVHKRREKKVNEFKRDIRNTKGVQPDLGNVDLSTVNLASRFPSFLCMGCEDGLKVNGSIIRIPHRMCFPLPSIMSYSKDEDICSLILRLVHSLPQGYLQVKVLDTERFGLGVKAISRLSSFGVMEVVTSPGDVDCILSDIETFATNLIRDGRFSGAVRDWAEYVRQNPHELLPYRIIVADSCAALTDDQASALKRIARCGSEIGVSVLLPAHSAARITRTATTLPCEGMPSVNALDGFFAAMEEAHSLSKSRPLVRQRSLVDIYATSSLWSGNAAESIEATLGFAEGSGSVVLCLGGENNHVLLGGTTGSGKSNLIHILIRSLCHDYSPEELRLYLLDYKDGLEFGKYVDGNSAWLPHVESVSVHNDPAYALSMFDFVQRECLQRKRTFAGARNYTEYRLSGGKMPRIVIIIDEFHKLFETVDAEGMSMRLMQVLKQGRAYGVHLILATQTLASSDIPNLAGMLGQIPVRLALRGSEDDRILDPDNLAATGIAIPKCVFNDQFGRNRGNRLFDVPEAIFDGSFKSVIVGALKSSSMDKGRGLVFNGMQMPSVSGARFAKIVQGEAARDVRVLIGEENAFCGRPIVLSLEHAPTAHVLIAASIGDRAMDDNGFLYREEAMLALKDDILMSLVTMRDAAIVCYNPRVDFVEACDSANISVCPASATDEVLRDMLAYLAASSAKERIFIVEDFEHAHLLHPAESGSYLQTEFTDADSARSVFMKAFSANSTRLPFHVVLITRNFRYVTSSLFYDAGTGLNLLKMFAYRVAVDLPLDDVQTLYSSYLCRDTAGKILFGSTQSDTVQAFLPYAIKES